MQLSLSNLMEKHFLFFSHFLKRREKERKREMQAFLLHILVEPTWPTSTLQDELLKFHYLQFLHHGYQTIQWISHSIRSHNSRQISMSHSFTLG